MLPTGRTEGIFIKVKPDIKKIIEQMRVEEDWSISAWFEGAFEQAFFSRVALEEEREKYLQLAAECKAKLDRLDMEAKIEEKLELNDREKRQLFIACDPAFSQRKQWGIFATTTKKKLSFPEFKKVKEIYLKKIINGRK